MSLPGFDEWKERLPREWDDSRIACVACGEDECDCGAASPHAEEASGGAVTPIPAVPVLTPVSNLTSPCTARDDALDPACAAGRKR